MVLHNPGLYTSSVTLSRYYGPSDSIDYGGSFFYIPAPQNHISVSSHPYIMIKSSIHIQQVFINSIHYDQRNLLSVIIFKLLSAQNQHIRFLVTPFLSQHKNLLCNLELQGG
jgi:hypothetical protein